MRKILEDFCNDTDRSKGLLLIDMPTGTGKTYSVAEYIANNYEKIKGKIIFVTQLKKNLPEDEIRKCFKKLGKEDEIDNVLLRVENNVDNLCCNFKKVKVELEKYIGDKFLIYKINREIELINSNNITDVNMFLVQQARDDLQNKLERDLRNKVTAYLSFDKDGKERSKEEKKKLLETDDEYRWIAKLYPTVNTDNKKILIMSLDKFLYRYSTIIEPPFNMFESDLIKNGIIFMDEFDGTKDVILKKIIKDGLENQLGIIELFREIYVGLFMPNFTKNLIDESAYNQKHKNFKKSIEIIKEFRLKAKSIYNDYKLKYQYKLREDSKTGVKFLFQDYKTYTIINGKEKFLNLTSDKTEQINWLNIDEIKPKTDNSTTEFEEDGSKVEKHSIYGLINAIQNFLDFFQTGVGFIADNYLHLKEEKEREIYNISRESAIRTVLAEFGLEGRYKNYLTSNILSSAKRHKFDWRQVSDQLDSTVYEMGFRYYQIVDNDNHDTMSRLNYVAFNDSPEKFLCRLVNRTKVVGISATATLPTVLSNYDINYIKSRCKELVYELCEEEINRLKRYFNQYIEKYNQIQIISNPIGFINNLSADAKKDFEEESNSITKDYLKERFLCFAEAVEFFFNKNNASIKSFLYFANSKGGEFYIDDESLLKRLFDRLKKHHCLGGELWFLYGNVDQFEKRKEEIQDLLQKGERVFVVSTYATMGAGQNMHYEYNNDSIPTVKVNNLEYNLNKKDFDAIYLETPSHIIVNNNKKIESDEEFVKYIYQIKFLQEVGDYTPWEIKERVRIAFIHRDSDEETFIKTRRTENYLLAYVKVAQQAIGRICRTANKNKNVYIFYQKGLEEYIRPIAKFFNNKLVNPEFSEFLKSCLQSCTKELQSEDYMKLQRLAKTKDERAQEFKDSIRNPWNLANIERWEKIRDEVLKKPTINDLSETEFQELYIKLPKIDNKFYLYDKYFPHTEKNLPTYSFEPSSGYNRIDADYVLLPQILQIPGVKDYFKKEGYATYFYKGKHILTSSILTSIYQGALGEVVGRFVLKYKMMDLLDLEFEDLPEHIYEKFDNRIEDIYFDFKNWSGEYNPDYKNEIKNIRRKMKKVDGRKLVVVNILKPNFAVKPYMENFSGAILVLPYLYDIHKKEWNYEGLKKLYKILITISL